MATTTRKRNSKPGPPTRWPERVSVQMSVEHREALERLADQRGESLAACARKLLTQHLDQLDGDLADAS